MRKPNGTKHIMTSVYSDISRCQKELEDHYEHYGTDTESYDKSTLKLHDSRLQDLSDSLKAKITLNAIEETFELDWKKG
jgi:hypothetical protein